VNRRTLLAAAGTVLASVTGYAAGTSPHWFLVVGTGRRAAGNPIETRTTVDGDAISYLEGHDAVRSTTRSAVGEPAAYTEDPFEQWANRRCAGVASEAVLPAIERRLDAPELGLGKGVEHRLFGLVVSVDYTTVRSREGDVEQRPSVPFDAVVDVAPRTVDATVSLDGHEHTRQVPVVVQRSERQPLEDGLQ
jgi:hypothetical protein